MFHRNYCPHLNPANIYLSWYTIWRVHGYEIHHYWCDTDHALLSWIDSITMYWLHSNIKNGPWGHISRHLFERSKGEIPAFHLAGTRRLILRQYSTEALHTAYGKSSCLPLDDGASHSVPLFQACIKLLPSLPFSCTHLSVAYCFHPYFFMGFNVSQVANASSAVLNECSDSSLLLESYLPGRWLQKMFPSF